MSYRLVKVTGINSSLLDHWLINSIGIKCTGNCQKTNLLQLYKFYWKTTAEFHGWNSCLLRSTQNTDLNYQSTDWQKSDSDYNTFHWVDKIWLSLNHVTKENVLQHKNICFTVSLFFLETWRGIEVRNVCSECKMIFCLMLRLFGVHNISFNRFRSYVFMITNLIAAD